jgi:hypothetical protein
MRTPADENFCCDSGHAPSPGRKKLNCLKQSSLLGWQFVNGGPQRSRMRGMLHMFTVEAGDFAGGFAVDRALFQIGTLVSSDFTLGDTKLSL